MAGVSPSLVSRIERGDLEPVAIGTLRKVASAVGVSVEPSLRWRGVELAKLLDERHAALVRDVAARLSALGWDVRPEITFAIGRESGSVDVLAWLPVARAVLVVEVKSLVPDLQETLAALDRKRRLARNLAEQLGWQPVLVGCVLVLPDEGQARLAVHRHEATLSAALPARTVEIRHWLARPSGDLRGIWFLHIDTGGGANQKPRTQMRVRRRMTAPRTNDPRSGPSPPNGPDAGGDRVGRPVPG
jgi:transcriptional regulator with XRE-family HTH domain